ncbi:MAG: HPr-rel-A system PqqD family peptide chaperone [Nitrosomonas sp.]|nr:HPr-rel-A system PqqD family peptide chaperone [Nitrosomonas sp.]
MRWLSDNFHTLLVADWDEEYTVFQPDSGKTHFFNQMSMEMLSFLSRRPVSIEEICDYLSRQSGQTPDENFQDNIEKILYHFNALGLVKKEN